MVIIHIYVILTNNCMDIEVKKVATKKVTVNLPADQVEFLQKLAAQENITFTDALKRSINAEQFFFEQKKNGRKLLVEENGHKLREIIRV